MKPKTDFKPFVVGTVFNPVKGGPYRADLKYEKVIIKYPSRLDIMAIDPSKIASNENLIYTPGEVVLKVDIYKTVLVKIRNDTDKIIISPSSKRPSLIRHAALIMKKALNFKYGLEIDVDNSNELRHVGLGSSSSLIAATGSAINELFGNPIPADKLVPYFAQNHGEEIDGKPNLINPVQCIGGSAASGLYSGALLILAGKSRVIQSMKISRKYKVIIGIPKDFVQLDSKILLEKELVVIDEFIECGRKYGPAIAYRVLHSVLPAMTEGDLKTVGDLVFDYRFKMGSIENCSYTYPNLVSLCNRLAFLKTENLAEILSISSVGPAIFAVTTEIDKCRQAFEKENLQIYIAKPENNRYRVLKKEPYASK
jgi:predicted sugar kinase